MRLSKEIWKYGRADSARRWEPNTNIKVSGSFRVSGPTRAWPFSYYHHALTAKYARLLARYQPSIWRDTVDPTSITVADVRWMKKNLVPEDFESVVTLKMIAVLTK